MSRLWKTIAVVAAAGLSAGVLGFALFAASVMRTPVAADEKADGIIVLTGGQSRIKEGARLLKDGYGSRLLISGVNARTGQADLIRLSGLDAQMFTCCVDLGYTALDTIGQRFGSSHVGPRQSLSLARRRHLQLSHAAYTGGAIPRDARRSAHPACRDPGRVRAPDLVVVALGHADLVAEYVKFLPSAARLALQLAVTPFERGSVATANGNNDRKT